MRAQISIPFEFEGLHVALDNCPDTLFGTAQIIVDKDLAARRTWRIGDIRIDMRPDVPEQRLRQESQVHDRLCFELTVQRRDEIDDRVNAALEDGGGYMALFGERMPTGGAGRTRARAGFYIPSSPVQDRAISRTVAL